jgi:hypothetical protein
MILPVQVAAQTVLPALTDVQVQNVLLLVKQYAVYIRNLGLFPDLAGKLADEQVLPTVKTQFVKAVLAALDELPEVVVESQGRDTAPALFTTKDNLDALALDVLNLFYDLPAGLLSAQSFALTQKKVETLLLADDMDAVLRNSILKR